MSRQFISVNEFMERSGLGKTTTFKLLRNNLLDSIKVGSRRLVSLSSVEAYLEIGGPTQVEEV